MGAVKIDITSKRRKLESAFPLESKQGILALLEQIHHVRESRYASDYDACDLLIDFMRSIQGARLTARQRLAIYLVFEKDLTQKEAAEYMNITQQGVNYHITQAVNKIALYNKQKQMEI